MKYYQLTEELTGNIELRLWSVTFLPCILLRLALICSEIQRFIITHYHSITHTQLNIY